jgi:hypothetical protein
MTINTQYIPAFNINEIILDKDTGAPLAGGQVTFYRDEQRSSKKSVYQITGTSPNYSFIQLPNPLTLNATGQFQDNLGNPIVPYFYPFLSDEVTPDLYFFTVYSAGNVSQFAREAVPYVLSSIDPPGEMTDNENQLANPQFVEVSFNPEESHTFNVTGGGTFNLAPDWDIIATGTGTITVSRVELVSTDTPTNPPYVIDITSAGISTLNVYQRLRNSPRLFAGSFVSGAFIAASQDALIHELTLSYLPSGGDLNNNIIIQDSVDDTGLYTAFQGNLQIEGDLNPDPATTGFVDISLEIPVGAHIRFSSLQVTNVAAALNVAFAQQSVARQEDHLFHYYKDSILMRPKDSISTGWNFAQNPFQFYPSALTIAATQCQYIADQTILYSETAASLSTLRESSGNNFALGIMGIFDQPDNLFALIEYIDPATIAPYWQNSNPLSCLVRAIYTGTVAPKLKMRIIYRSTLPPAISATEPIASFSPGSDPVFAAGWTAIAPLNDPEYTMTSDTTQYHDYAFENFVLPIMPASAATIGIVLYSTERLDSSGLPGSFILERRSCVPNEFAIDETPRSFDETLRRCQFYFEKSYDWSVAIGTATNQGQRTVPMRMSDAGDAVILRSFELDFKSVKRSSSYGVEIYPIVSPVSISNASLSVLGDGAYVAMSSGSNPENIPTTHWNIFGQSTANVWFKCNSSLAGVPSFSPISANNLYEAILQYHYTIDDRLGV